MPASPGVRPALRFPAVHDVHGCARDEPASNPTPEPRGAIQPAGHTHKDDPLGDPEPYGLGSP